MKYAWEFFGAVAILCLVAITGVVVCDHLGSHKQAPAQEKARPAVHIVNDPEGARPEFADDMLVKNRAGKDYAGLSLPSAIETAARAQGITEIKGFTEWCSLQPGGSYSEKNRKQLRQFCEPLDVKVPAYEEHSNADLSFIQGCLEHRRYPIVEYRGGDPERYGGSKVSHVVLVVALNSKSACIVDTNYLEPSKRYHWVTRDQLVRQCGIGKDCWAFAWRENRL